MIWLSLLIVYSKLNILFYISLSRIHEANLMDYWVRKYFKNNMAHIHQDNTWNYLDLSFKNLKFIFNIWIYGVIFMPFVFIMEILFCALYKYANFKLFC